MNFTNLTGQTGVGHHICLQNKFSSFSAAFSSVCRNLHLVPIPGYSKSWLTNLVVNSSSHGLRIKVMVLRAGSLPNSWRMRRWVRVHRKVTMPKRAAHAGTGPRNSCLPHLAKWRASLYRMVSFLSLFPSLRRAHFNFFLLMLGTVIFACHKVESSVRSTSTGPATMEHQLAYNVNNASGYPPTSAPYYEPPTSYPPLTPAYDHGYLTHQSLPTHRSPSTYPSSRWSQVQQQQNYPSTQPPSSHQPWTTPSPTHPISPLPPLPPSVHTSSSMGNSHLRSGAYSSTLAPGPSWQASPGSYDVYRAPSPGYGTYSTSPQRSAPTSSAGTSILPAASSLLSTNALQDIVPPPKRRVSPGSVRGGDQYNPAAPSSGRGSGNRPSGILECSSCGATTSPEWRKGPSGKKELCNAYVLFFSWRVWII